MQSAQGNMQLHVLYMYMYFVNLQILYEGGKRKKTDSSSSDPSNETEPSGNHSDGVTEDSKKESVEQGGCGS